MQHLSSVLVPLVSLVLGATACSFSKDTYVNPGSTESEGLLDLDASPGVQIDGTEGLTGPGPSSSVGPSADTDTDVPGAENTDDPAPGVPQVTEEPVEGTEVDPGGSERDAEAGTNELPDDSDVLETEEPSEAGPTEEGGTEDPTEPEETEEPPPTCACQGDLQCVELAGILQCVNACAQNNGGCDPLAECQNTNTLDGPACGACPIGYSGDGTTGCAPALSDLGLSHGTLEPELDPGLDTYDVRVPMFIRNITLTPIVPFGASVTINGLAVSRGSTWASATLDFGNTELSLVVAQPGQPSSEYTLNLRRTLNTAIPISASNGEENDGFGRAIALSSDGRTLAVGADGEDGNGSNMSNNSTNGAGAVYVYTRNNAGIWSSQAYLKAATPVASSLFGTSVSLSGDGSILAVGARGEGSHAGAVYVFARNTAGSWVQQARLEAHNPDPSDWFGIALAVSGDGSTLAVGASSEDGGYVGQANQHNNDEPNAGAAYVFKMTNGSWAQQAYLKAYDAADGDAFGSSIAISNDGMRIAVGARQEDGSSANPTHYDEGAVYMFRWNSFNGSWDQPRRVKASNLGQTEMFGRDVALSGDGRTMVASGQASRAIVFSLYGENEWAEAEIFQSPTPLTGYFGVGLSLTYDGNTLAIGAADFAAERRETLHVYTRNSGGWLKSTQWSYREEASAATAPIVLSSDGNTLAAMGETPDSKGVVYVYR